MKINIVGTSASGKSTFGRKLAKAIDAPYIEMDAIFWGPDWYQTPDADFFKKLESKLSSSTSWVLDGNYTRSVPIKWQEVDIVIWLDYSFARTIYQSISRAISRSFSKSELWPNTGNVESFGRMFSKDSIILWSLKNHPKNRVKYKKAMQNADYAHIQFIRITSPKQAEEYLQSQSVAPVSGE